MSQIKKVRILFEIDVKAHKEYCLVQRGPESILRFNQRASRGYGISTVECNKCGVILGTWDEVKIERRIVGIVGDVIEVVDDHDS